MGQGTHDRKKNYTLSKVHQKGEKDNGLFHIFISLNHSTRKQKCK